MAGSIDKRSFFKDVKELYKSVESSTDGQATIIGISEMAVHLSLKPKTGFNAHAAFDLFTTCDYSYPKVPPSVAFGSPIFHPNIDPRAGFVCLSLLSDWRPCYSLLDVVKAVLYLIEHPNFDSPNNSFATLTDASELETKTKRLLAGLTVNGCRFSANTAWCAWAMENNCLPNEDDEVITMESDPKNMLSSGELDPCMPLTSFMSSIPRQELNEESQGESSICTSETVPSFAKIRHSIASIDESIAPYGESYHSLKVASQRIAIIQPAFEQKAQRKSVYYFAEVWCNDHHRDEVGIHFPTLFSLSNLPPDEESAEFCQNSHLCLWNPTYSIVDYSYASYSPYSSSLNLSELFDIKTPKIKSLTDDFCQWAAEDGLGTKNILSGLFCEKQRRFSSGTSSGSDYGFQELFETNSAEIYDCTKTSDSVTSSHWETDAEIPDVEYEVEEEVSEIDNNNVDDIAHNEDATSASSLSSSSYVESGNEFPKMHECRECQYTFQASLEAMNRELRPHPTWLFRQTRWSIRFAPRQTALLAMDNIRLPPWRVSSARLLADVCLYCKRYSNVKNLVLLDPMTLSPMSPLLNLMHHSTNPIPQLTGVLWMTPMEAISPFYRVPIPAYPSGDEEVNFGYPRPFSLRFLTLAAFVTNWIAWLSRVETYASTGLTRFTPLFITDSIAARYIELRTLGCGQAPVIDLWPLWLLRRLLNTSLSLSKLNFSLPFLRPTPLESDFNFFFPFSDMDEI